MKKKMGFILVLISLMVLSTICVQQIKAQNSNSITINSDGSVTPTTATIKQTGNVYTLTSDFDGAINVYRRNSILNGNGNSISAAQANGVSNVTLENFIIKAGEQFGEIHVGVFAGIFLSGSSNVVVANNTVSEVTNFVSVFVYYETVAGIVVVGGRSNVILGNNLVNNWQGIDFSDTSNNLVIGNNLTSSFNERTGYAEPGGINFNSASNNTIYHNNFEIQTGGQAKDSYYNSVNFWDAGYPLGGNYWSDYKSKYRNAVEIDKSGIGNTSYVIDESLANLANNTDRYPLMKPFNSTFYSLQIAQPKISIISPLNQTYNVSSVCLTFSVSVFSPVKTVSWNAYCLDEASNVTLASNSPITNITLANLTIGFHNVTVFANDTYGNMANPQTINFTIQKPAPASFPAVPVASVSVAVLALVVAGLLIYRKQRKPKLPNHGI
jgi:parallel beta-helix repeat protein